MLKAFLIKMKEIPLIEYSEGMTLAIKSLMNNEKLLNVFVSILL